MIDKVRLVAHWAKKSALSAIDWLWATAKAVETWVGVLVAGLISLGVYLSIAHWSWLQSGTDQSSNSAVVRNIALVIGGLVAIVVAVWRSLVAGRQARVSHRGLLNERYQKGAEMLGNGVLSVRLGGIYALRSLAEEHPQPYGVQILRLFCAFVRDPKNVTPSAAEVPADIQAAMDAVVEYDRRKIAWTPSLLNLFGADLRYLNLEGANLEGGYMPLANLEKANLARADLRNATLKSANLSEAGLFSADLSDADLTNAKLMGASLSTADLSDANLRQADLTEAELWAANLWAVNLMRANLSGANLSGTDLSKADLVRANLAGADLSEADLSDANLSEADLSDANLSEADLSDANLSGVNLSDANLSGANLSEVRELNQEQLLLACGDAHTRLPIGLMIPVRSAS